MAIMCIAVEDAPRWADVSKSIAPFGCDLLGDFLTPSPPAEKATARGDQTRQSCTRDGPGTADGDEKSVTE
jgi:hypothetical protein